MKTKNIAAIILIAFSLISCVKERQLSALPFDPPFKPALEQVITGLIDSLKDEIGKNQLLSIQFFTPKYYDTSCKIIIFQSDWYASGYIEAYTKIGNTTIAIYSIENDFYELVNKNAITFFTDTLIGFKDFGRWKTTEGVHTETQFYCLIYNEDSIGKISTEKPFGSFPQPDLIRMPKNGTKTITFTPSEEYYEFHFHDDSIYAEEDFEYYEKQVKYYRNKLNSTSP